MGQGFVGFQLYIRTKMGLRGVCTKGQNVQAERRTKVPNRRPCFSRYHILA